jgi:nicotinamidase-related amidase
MEVLLVIDMQNAWLNNAARSNFDADDVVKRINRAAAAVRQRNGKVVYVQHGDNDAIVGSFAWQLIPALDFVDGDWTIEKRACDPFSDTDLLTQLEALGARTVYVSGFATEFCVDSAIRATTSHGFDVVALSDAHTTGDRPYLKAGDVIAHHNWVWANMVVPATSSIKVCKTEEAFPENLQMLTA